MMITKNKKITDIILIVLVLLVPASSGLALPPDPDNAALLYYQVFLIYEKPDDTMQDMIADLASGKIEPDTRITEFIESQKAVIELAVAAGELPTCDWGLKYSEGFLMQVPYLAQTRNLARLILADARTTATKGDYDLAIDRCLTARKLAVHVASDPTFINFLVGISIERISNKCVQDILSAAPIELETLQYLKGQLDKLDNRLLPIELYYDAERQVMAMYMTAEKIREVLPFLESEGKPESNNARELILAADPEFCQRNKDYHNEHMTAILSSLDLPYQEAYARLGSLGSKLSQEFKENPDATMTAILAPATQRIYNHHVHRKTSSNALKTALEIYIINAQTGQLPDLLPAGLPKDLFSSKPFQYEKTAEGFILRCRGRDLDKDKVHEYEFKVAK